MELILFRTAVVVKNLKLVINKPASSAKKPETAETSLAARGKNRALTTR